MDLDRRTFLCVAASAAAGAALPSCASVAAMPVVPNAGVVRLPLRAHPRLLERDGFVRLQLPNGAGQIHVLALGDGEFAAVSPVCTHRGCTVDVAGTHLVCPCHGSTYDREGRVLRGPAERALQRFATAVTPEGDLVITVGEGR